MHVVSRGEVRRVNYEICSAGILSNKSQPSTALQLLLFCLRTVQYKTKFPRVSFNYGNESTRIILLSFRHRVNVLGFDASVTRDLSEFLKREHKMRKRNDTYYIFAELVC